MDPKDFHQLARTLANIETPAELRTATSRAYYAVYLVAVQILEGMGFRISKGPGGHGEVQRYLNNCGNTDLAALSSNLYTLHNQRIRADYRLEMLGTENPKNVRFNLDLSAQMILTLESNCFGQQRTQIIDAIQEWRRKISS